MPSDNRIGHPRRKSKWMFACAARPPLQLLLVVTVLLPLLIDPTKAASFANLPPVQIFANGNISDWYPPQITLRAGALLNPPYVMIAEQNGGDYHTNYSRVANIAAHEELQYTGFSVDLLRRIQLLANVVFNVSLNVLLEPLPTNWNYAVDLVANDCNTFLNPLPDQDCEKFDFIVGGFITSPQRFRRVDFTPPFFYTYITTMKYLDSKLQRDYETIAQVLQDNQTICLPEGSATTNVVTTKHPQLDYVLCEIDSCIDYLKNDKCVLFCDDYIALRSLAFLDSSLEVTSEQFNGQFNSWPMSYSMPPTVSHLLKYLMHEAIHDPAIDELQNKYFTRELCPIGTAGLNCELPCHPDHGSPNTQGECVCASPRWIGKDCSIEVPEDTQLIPQPLKMAAYSMVAISFATVLACTCWLYLNQSTPQVQISQPLFLGLVLLGCSISTSSIVAMAQEHEGQGPVKACMAVPWLYSVGFCVTFGTLFVKIYRIWTVFRSAAEFRRIAFTAKDSFVVIGLVLSVDVCVLLVWTIVDPLEWERVAISSDQFGTPLQSAGKCDSDHWAVFAAIIATLHVCLLAVASYLCYASRNLPTSFSEGKYLSIAMVSNLQIFLVGLPVLVIVGSDPATSFFVRSAIIWMNDIAVVLLIFGNLILSTRRKQQEMQQGNSVQNLLRNAIQEYSSACRDSGAESDMENSAQRESGDESDAGIANYGKEMKAQRLYEMERLEIAKELSTPPTSDDQHVKVVWGRRKHWCAICNNFFGSPGLWTDHNTADHQKLLALKETATRNDTSITAAASSATTDEPD